MTISYAQSIDGSIATRQSSARCPSAVRASMRMTHGLRALHDGILVGIETVLADDPQLSVRLVDRASSPAGSVLDTRLRTPFGGPPAERRPETGAPGCWARPTIRPRQGNGHDRCRSFDVLPCRREDEQRKAGFARKPSVSSTRRGIRRLMVEGGARVITSFIRAQLVDLFIITIAPKLVGGLQVMTAPPNGVRDAAYGT